MSTNISSGPDYDAKDGMYSGYNTGDIWINTDGARYITAFGKWRLQQAAPPEGHIGRNPPRVYDGMTALPGTEGDTMFIKGVQYRSRGGKWEALWATTTVAKPSPPITFATVTATCKLEASIPDKVFGPPAEPEATVMFDDRGARYEVTVGGWAPTTTNESLAKHVPQHVYSGPVAQPVAQPWHEDSTCRGILRALEEAKAKHPTAVHELGGPMERARIALLKFDKALGKVDQGGWHQDGDLKKATGSLAFCCFRATYAGMRFGAVSPLCDGATDAVTAAIAALDKAGAK